MPQACLTLGGIFLAPWPSRVVGFVALSNLRQNFFHEISAPHEQGRSPMKNQTDSFTTLALATTSDACLATRLKASGLSCRRGHEWLFRDLSFSICPGQMVWLRGPNGSGKTTLLRAVVGLTQADEGALEWSSGDAKTGAAERPRVVYIGHSNAMKDDLTVCESLQFLAGLHECDASRKAGVEALRRLGLHHRRNAPVRTFSQGLRRRAALARLAWSASRHCGCWTIHSMRWMPPASAL